MPKLEHDRGVYVLGLGDGENRFTRDWLAEVNALLSEVEADDGPKALVTVAHAACPRSTYAFGARSG